MIPGFVGVLLRERIYYHHVCACVYESQDQRNVSRLEADLKYQELSANWKGTGEETREIFFFFVNLAVPGSL